MSRRLLFAPSLATLALAVLWAPLRAEEAQSPEHDWELVRSVSNPYSGTIDLVLIPEHKQRDRVYYYRIANETCGDRTSCMINFCADRAHIPDSANMPVRDLAVMLASYERSPNYKAPVLSLACRLYPNREIAELNKCGYFPGSTDLPGEFRTTGYLRMAPWWVDS